MRMMLNRRDNGEDGKTENTQGRPDGSYSLQELLILPQPMIKVLVCFSSDASVLTTSHLRSEIARIVFRNNC